MEHDSDLTLNEKLKGLGGQEGDVLVHDGDSWKPVSPPASSEGFILTSNGENQVPSFQEPGDSAQAIVSKSGTFTPEELNPYQMGYSEQYNGTYISTDGTNVLPLTKGVVSRIVLPFNQSLQNALNNPYPSNAGIFYITRQAWDPDVPRIIKGWNAAFDEVGANQADSSGTFSFVDFTLGASAGYNWDQNIRNLGTALPIDDQSISPHRSFSSNGVIWNSGEALVLKVTDFNSGGGYITGLEVAVHFLTP